MYEKILVRKCELGRCWIIEGLNIEFTVLYNYKIPQVFPGSPTWIGRTGREELPLLQKKRIGPE